MHGFISKWQEKTSHYSVIMPYDKKTCLLALTAWLSVAIHSGVNKVGVTRGGNVNVNVNVNRGFI